MNNGHGMTVNAITTTIRTHRISPPALTLRPPGIALAPPPPLFRPSVAANNRGTQNNKVGPLGFSSSATPAQPQRSRSLIAPPLLPPKHTHPQHAHEDDPHHPLVLEESLSSLHEYDQDLFMELDSSLFDDDVFSASNNRDPIMDAALQRRSGCSGISSTAAEVPTISEGFDSQHHYVSFPDGHALTASTPSMPPHHAAGASSSAMMAQDDVRSIAASSSSDESSGLFPTRELDEMFDDDDGAGTPAVHDTTFYYGL